MELLLFMHPHSYLKIKSSHLTVFLCQTSSPQLTLLLDLYVDLAIYSEDLFKQTDAVYQGGHQSWHEHVYRLWAYRY